MTRKRTTTPTTAPTEATERGGELVHVDPGTLQTTANVRADLHVDDSFQASIADLGVQVPIVAVRGANGALNIEHGHRRAAAAAAAGLTRVPVVVLDAEQAESARVMSQLAENQARAALSSAELVAAHEQLGLLGVTVEQAARATGTTKDRVRAARTIAGDSTAGSWLAENSETQLDLEQVAVLAEFSDDPELVAELAELAGDGLEFEFKRAAESAREDRERDGRLADAAKEWIARGWQVAVHSTWRDRVEEAWVPLWKLRTADAAVVGEEDLAQSPGRAAVLTEAMNWQTREPSIRASLYCISPTDHGFTLVVPSSSWSGQAAEVSQEAKTAERRKVLAQNKDWRAAETVRRQHVHDWLASAKPTPEIQRWALGELLRGVDAGYSTQAKLTDLGWASDVLRGTHNLGVNPTASGPRTSIGVLTLVLASRELDTDVQSWRNPAPDSATARYLKFLVTHTGYELGNVEKLATGAPPRKAPAKGAAAGEQDPQVEAAQHPVDAGAAADAEPEKGLDAPQGPRADPLGGGLADPLSADSWESTPDSPDIAAASR